MCWKEGREVRWRERCVGGGRRSSAFSITREQGKGHAEIWKDRVPEDWSAGGGGGLLQGTWQGERRGPGWELGTVSTTAAEPRGNEPGFSRCLIPSAACGSFPPPELTGDG